MLEKLKEYVKKMNSYGIPVPLIHDPKSGPSVSLTLLFISSLFVEVGLIGKFTKFLDGVDINQAINWFMVCAGLYFARNVKNSKSGTQLESSVEEKEKDNVSQS